MELKKKELILTIFFDDFAAEHNNGLKSEKNKINVFLVTVLNGAGAKVLVE